MIATATNLSPPPGFANSALNVSSDASGDMPRLRFDTWTMNADLGRPEQIGKVFASFEQYLYQGAA